MIAAVLTVSTFLAAVVALGWVWNAPGSPADGERRPEWIAHASKRSVLALVAVCVYATLASGPAGGGTLVWLPVVPVAAATVALCAAERAASGRPVSLAALTAGWLVTAAVIGFYTAASTAPTVTGGVLDPTPITQRGVAAALLVLAVAAVHLTWARRARAASRARAVARRDAQVHAMRARMDRAGRPATRGRTAA